MNKALIIAVVAVVVVAGAAVAMVMDGNDDGDPGYDTIRTDLEVGDYISYNEIMEYGTESVGEQSAESFLTDIYWTSGIPESVVRETLQFKGSPVECHVFDTAVDSETVTVYASVESLVIYKTVKKDLTTTLTDTDMDLSKGMDDQILTEGTSVTHHMEWSDGKNLSDTTLKVESVDGDTVTVTMSTMTRMVWGSCDRISVIDADGTLHYEGEDILDFTKEEFLAGISYSAYMGQLGDVEVVFGEMIETQVETDRGNRTVYVQDIEYTDGSGERSRYTLYFGTHDVLYKTVWHMNEGQDLIRENTDTSLWN